jgi:hypothetical protein|tara:strand:+ start:304 stop:549 length:246 start_codon:yes stop_codon:yes gene_type:complete
MVKLCDLVNSLPAKLLSLSLKEAIASSSTRERRAAARASIMRARSIDHCNKGLGAPRPGRDALCARALKINLISALRQLRK